MAFFERVEGLALASGLSKWLTGKTEKTTGQPFSCQNVCLGSCSCLHINKLAEEMPKVHDCSTAEKPCCLWSYSNARTSDSTISLACLRLCRIYTESGVTAKFIHTDVSKEADVKAMVDFVKDNFGRLDYTFDNAGRKGGNLTTVSCYCLPSCTRVMQIACQVPYPLLIAGFSKCCAVGSR